MEDEIELEEAPQPQDWGDLNPLARYLDTENAPLFPWSASEAEGLLAGLAAGPETIPEKDWLDALFNVEPGLPSKEIPADVLDCLRRRLAAVILQLSAGDESYRPMLIVDDDFVSSSDWADGFMLAFALREPAWEPLLKHPRSGVLMIPILSVYYTQDDVPFLDLTVQEQDEAADAAPEVLPLAVQAIYNFFRNRETRRTQRQASALPPAGRNDPCPCGSGKKYKKCCL